jgi:hypothetical protein
LRVANANKASTAAAGDAIGMGAPTSRTRTGANHYARLGNKPAMQ